MFPNGTFPGGGGWVGGWEEVIIKLISTEAEAEAEAEALLVLAELGNIYIWVTLQKHSNLEAEIHFKLLNHPSWLMVPHFPLSKFCL